MPLFQIAHEVLASDQPFPELLAGGGPPTLSFQLSSDSRPDFGCYQQVRSVELDEGRLWMQVGRSGDEYLLDFPEFCSFIFSCRTGHVICLAGAEPDMATIRHLFIDQVLPLIFNQRGRTVLHGSAVVSPSGGALVFLGKSGSGKSTLAASLCADGCALIADDSLVLEEHAAGFRAVPLYPGLRLWDESTTQLKWDGSGLDTVASYTSKKRVGAMRAGLRFAAVPAPVEAIFLVNQDGLEVQNLQIIQTEPVEAVIALVGSSYCLDPENRQRNEVDFARLSRLSQQVPVMHVRYPYDFSRLPELREAVLSAPINR